VLVDRDVSRADHVLARRRRTTVIRHTGGETENEQLGRGAYKAEYDVAVGRGKGLFRIRGVGGV
jgi:hypothetical protein